MDRIDNRDPLGLFSFESDDRVIGDEGVSLTLLTTLGEERMVA